jgi:hypothetical protein
MLAANAVQPEGGMPWHATGRRQTSHRDLHANDASETTKGSVRMRCIDRIDLVRVRNVSTAGVAQAVAGASEW